MAALLLTAAASYVEGYADRSSRDQARREAARIVTLAGAEYAASGPGSDARITVDIPRCVKRLSFSGNLYYIEYADGSNETYIAPCPFSPVVLYPGDHPLNINITYNGTYAATLEALDV